MNTNENEMLLMIRKLFQDLNINQRYAAYNFFDALGQCAQTRTERQKVNERIQMAALELNINPLDADNRINSYGVGDLCYHLGNIPKGAALDSIIATAYGISLMAKGSINGHDASRVAQNIFFSTLLEAGFSEDFISSSLEKTAAIMNTFGM